MVATDYNISVDADDNLVDFDLQPGVLSAIAFVALEAIAIGLIDYATGRVLSWYYYRLLAKGHKIELQEANIPGVTRYQIGRRFAIHNVFATLVKIVVLALIFYINLSITSRIVRKQKDFVYMSTFAMSPSDAALKRNYNYTVQREFDESRGCFEEENGVITFYPIVFNLTDGVVLENDEWSPNTGGQSSYLVNVSTIICAKPQKVINPKPLAKIVGCTRVVAGGCKNSTKISVPLNNTRSMPWIANGNTVLDSPSRVYNVTTFDPMDVKKWFGPRFTKDKTIFSCLSYHVGADIEKLRITVDCLLVYRPGSETWAEKWRLQYNPEKGKIEFVLTQPGPIFDQDIPFGESVSFVLLRIVDSDLFSRDNYLKLGANLVALSSDFVGRTKVYLPHDKTVSSMPLVAIGFSFAIFTFAIFAAVLVIIAVIRDSRPRINTIHGLSTVMRYHFLKARGFQKPRKGSHQEPDQMTHPIIGVEEEGSNAVFVSLPRPNDKDIN